MVGDGPRTSPLRLGIQRNTTMGSLTFEHCDFGNHARAVLTDVATLNTTLTTIKVVSDAAVTAADRDAVLAAAKRRVPVDFEQRRRWRVEDRIVFVSQRQNGDGNA